jgi:hypothetical protein
VRNAERIGYAFENGPQAGIVSLGNSFINFG